jgi:hypothetical protein
MRKISYPSPRWRLLPWPFASFSIAGEGKDKDKKKDGGAQSRGREDRRSRAGVHAA